jgi:hypothetical protein
MVQPATVRQFSRTTFMILSIRCQIFLSLFLFKLLSDILRKGELEMILDEDS